MPWPIQRVLRRVRGVRVSARRADILVAVVVAFAVGGCGSSMKVATDYDKAANFAPLKTYSWRNGTPLPNPLMSQRVVAAIDAQLKSKGLTRVDSGGDVSVTYHAAADKQMDVQSFSTGSTYSCWGGCSTSTTVTPVTVGTLIVDLVDTKNDKMLWRGTATDTVSDNPAENQQKINDGVKRMFANFPPKS